MGYKMNLLEAGLSRIFTHYKNRLFAILTAWRADRSLGQNQDNMDQITSDIRASGLGFIRCRGKGSEIRPDGTELAFDEPSLVVIGDKYGGEADRFRTDMVTLARKYKQDFIIVNVPGKAVEEVSVRNGKVRRTTTVLHFNVIADFYTQLTQGRTFSAKFEALLTEPAPINWLSLQGRKGEGEIFDLCEKDEETLIQKLRVLAKGV